MKQLDFDDGVVVSCKRCGCSCRVDAFGAQAPPSKPIDLGVAGGAIGAFRKARAPEGVCATCAVREWFYLLRHTIPVEVKPEALLLPQMQEQFAEILRVTGAEMRPDEIDWQKLADEWDLPIPSAGTGIDKQLMKLDEDPLWEREPPRRRIDMRPSRGAGHKQRGVGVDDFAQARAATKRGLLN